MNVPDSSTTVSTHTTRSLLGLSPLRQAQVRAISLHVRADPDHCQISGQRKPWWAGCGVRPNELDEVLRLAVSLGLVRVEVQRTNINTHMPVVVATDMKMEPAPPEPWFVRQTARLRGAA